LEALGGGASKLGRKTEGSTGLPRLWSLESELWASTNEAGTDEALPCLSWRLARRVRCEVSVAGVGGSVVAAGVADFPLCAAAASESPRVGRSACRDGGSTTGAIGAWFSFRFGSSNGFTPDCCDSSEAGDADRSLSPTSSLSIPFTGDITLGDLSLTFELLRDPAFLTVGTSCSLNPSLWVNVKDPVSRCCGFGRSGLPSGPGTAGEAAVEADMGVLFPEVSRFGRLPFS